MKNFSKRIKATLGLDVSTLALLGGVAIATTFVAAHAWNSEEIAFHKAAPTIYQQNHPEIPMTPYERMLQRKLLREKNLD